MSGLYWSIYFGHVFLSTPIVFLYNIGWQSTIVGMRLELAGIPNDPIRDLLLRFLKRGVADLGNPFRFLSF